jgi:uncharacterized protein HemY
MPMTDQDRATTAAIRGRLALVRLRYREAAGHFERAAGLWPDNVYYAEEAKKVRALAQERSSEDKSTY